MGPRGPEEVPARARRALVAAVGAVRLAVAPRRQRDAAATAAALRLGWTAH